MSVGTCSNLRQAVRSRWDICQHLPAPGEEYTAREVAESMGVEPWQIGNCLRKLEQYDIVIHTGKDEYYDGRRLKKHNTWRTHEEVHAVVDAIRDDEDVLVLRRTIRGGDGHESGDAEASGAVVVE
jgi:DNA-binding GntR family transcriptional regulator